MKQKKALLFGAASIYVIYIIHMYAVRFYMRNCSSRGVV